MSHFVLDRATTPVRFSEIGRVDTRRLGVVNPGHFFNVEDETDPTESGMGGSHLSPDAISETPPSDGEGE